MAADREIHRRPKVMQALHARPRPAAAARAPRPRGAAARRRGAAAAAAPPRAAAAPADSNAGISGYNVEGYRPTSPKAWEIQATYLKKSGKLTFISPAALEAAARKGSVVLDVRPADAHARGRIPGSVPASFYRLIEVRTGEPRCLMSACSPLCPLADPRRRSLNSQLPLPPASQGWSPVKFLRRAVFAFFGILDGTEHNPDFVKQAAAAAPRKQVSVFCNTGGSLFDPTYKPSAFGQQSRSLSAAYELVKAGFKVQVLEGGLAVWIKEGRRVEQDA
jgi:rhodanese-related sulfurtransferase